MLRPALLFAALGPLLATSSLAHDFWIEPSEFEPAAGDRVFLTLNQGVEYRGETLPYIEEWFRDFSRVDATGRSEILAFTGDDPIGPFAGLDGQVLFGYWSTRSFVELDAEKFNQYLEHEGIEFLRELRRERGEDDQPAPEYFVRCAKTLLQGPAGGADVYDAVLGYTLELVALENPYDKQTGDQLTFQLLFRGEPIEGLLVQGFTRAEPERIEKVRTDQNGQASITLDRNGEWFVKAVQIQPIIGDPKALWQSYWATYLFELDGVPAK